MKLKDPTRFILPAFLIAVVVWSVYFLQSKSSFFSFLALSFDRQQEQVLASSPPFPLVGAIRWDAWNAGATNWGANNAGLWGETALSSPEWHYRLPFFSIVSASGTVQIRLDSQEKMDQEIAYAKAGGLDYWAFDYYGSSPHPLTKGLDLYMTSFHKNDLHFALILTEYAFQNNFPAAVVSYLQDPQYRTVLGGRPLIYIFENNPAITRGSFDTLRSTAQSAGLPNPYIVWLSLQAATVKIAEFGLDAVSSYAMHPTGNIGQQVPYGNLSTVDQQYWNDAKAANIKVVPIITTGWDPRPMWNYPPPWNPTYATDTPYTIGTASEIAQHLQGAANWVNSNPANVEANTILMYAWNEFAEGGWLDPLLDTGAERLNAISQVIAGVSSYDSQPPVVSITNPAVNSLVSGAVTVTADASDNIGIIGVQFKLDGLNLGAEVTSAPYSINWGATTVTNGTHILTAVARDASLNSTNSAEVLVFVSNNSTPIQPVGSWNLNDGVGTITSDISGNGNNGALVGGALWVTGKTGGGIALDGIDDYVTVPDSTLLDGMKAITVSEWVNLSQLPTQNYVPLGKDSGGASYRITIGPSGKAFFTVNTTNNGWYTSGTNVMSLSSIPLNTWKHIVGTYDGNYVRIYIDGVLETASSQVISGPIVNTSSTLRFGNKTSVNVDYTNGNIDEISIYSVALSPSEVQALYNTVVQNADTVAPTVSIMNPANNSNISGNVSITAGASDNKAVSKVEFYVDTILLSTDVVAPYTAVWDSTSSTVNSSHTIKAKAYDTQNNIGTSPDIIVTIVDVDLPSISITNPLNNSTVTRNSKVNIQANAHDIYGISKVEFYVKGVLKCTDTTAPYSCSWTVPQQKNITYTLQSKAYDTANNIGTSATVTVTSK